MWKLSFLSSNPASNQILSPKPKKILCVDDDLDILKITRICLVAVGGFEVSTCAISTEVIACVQAVKPDLVLLDVMMPEIDGPTIFKLFQADPDLRTIPVIFMTARVQEREVEEYLKLGAAAVIAKPFDPMELSVEVVAAWRKAKGLPDD